MAIGGNFWKTVGDIASAPISQSTNGSSGFSNAYTDWTTAARYNLAAMRERNKFNSAEAQKDRDWQERMSNTAFQRQMADLAAAGINPAMVAQLGGRSTPGGATRSARSANIGASEMSNSRSSAFGQSSSMPVAANMLSSAYDYINANQGKVDEKTLKQVNEATWEAAAAENPGAKKGKG